MELHGGGAPVKEGRRGLVGKLRGEVGDRFRGLSRAEESWGVELRGELLAAALMAGDGGSGHEGSRGFAQLRNEGARGGEIEINFVDDLSGGDGD